MADRGIPTPFGKRVTLFEDFPDWWKEFINNLRLESPSLGNLLGQVKRVATTNTKIPKLTMIFESKNYYFNELCLNQHRVAAYFMDYSGYENITTQIIAAIDGGKKSAR